MQWSEFKSDWTELVFLTRLDLIKDSPPGIEYIYDSIFSIVSREIFSGRGPSWWSPDESRDLVFLRGEIIDDLEAMENLDIVIGCPSDEGNEFTVRLFVRKEQIEIWDDVFGEWIREKRGVGEQL